MTIFEAFETPKDLRAHYETSPCTAGVMGLKTLNVICGPNNSGKSRLLRSLVHSFPTKQGAFISGYGGAGPQLNQDWQAWLNQMAKQLQQTAYYVELALPIQKLGRGDDQYYKFLSLLLGDTSAFVTNPLTKLTSVRFDVHNARDSLIKASSGNENPVHFAYVPAIRTARDIGDPNSIYAHVLRRYFKGAFPEDRLFGGQELYSRVRQCLLGQPAMRQRIKDFERVLSQEFFDAREVSLSPREDGDNRELHIRIEPERERPVSELGDGMQSIIIQLAPAFLLRGKSLILFIEEPELYLHPGLQRRLFEVLLDLDKYTHWERHQVFVTSHSNHLLDLTLDHDRIAILRVEKTVGDRSDDAVLRATAEEDAKFKVEMVAPGEIRLLHDLGVQSSSVFLSNCTIWVEGPTDRTIIRHYMELIAQRDGVELREDLDFSFVYYAGSLAERLSLLDNDGPDVDRMCSRMFFIADGDIAKKAGRAERLREKLGNRFHLLACREIENTVSAAVLRMIVATWTKSQTDDLGMIDEGLIPTEGIGKLIVDNYGAVLKDGHKWADADGGLPQSRKAKFADLAREHTKTTADLSPAALAVAEAAVAFVRDHRAAANTMGG